MINIIIYFGIKSMHDLKLFYLPFSFTQVSVLVRVAFTILFFLFLEHNLYLEENNV